MVMHEILKKDPEIWDLFTRKEEYTPSFRDKYNRFPYYASRYRTVFEPKASEYLVNNGYHAEYPDGKPFAVCLTHDIDAVYDEPVKSKVFDALKYSVHGNFSKSFDFLRQISSNINPYKNFKEIMDLEDRYNARSSFYFLAIDPHDEDYEYLIEDLESELSTIQNRGWEVGLHVGHEGSRDLHKLLLEKKSLEKVIGKSVTGCRNHYLNFVVPDTWELLAGAGIEYDCSFGYGDCAGFRNGMCHPYRPYNLNTGKTIEIIEIPLVIMDSTLFDSYMRLDSDGAWDVTRHLIDVVAGCHGVITLLWHNTSLVGDQIKFYEKILNYCAARNAWMTSGEQILAWWKHNGKP
jgi:peptidoglycan/xylan/chitin deacetylase (PgdA/CDA1 family)